MIYYHYPQKNYDCHDTPTSRSFCTQIHLCWIFDCRRIFAVR